MMTEEEGWDMHGLIAWNASAAAHRFGTNSSTFWASNMGVPKEFADHLLGLQKDPDQYFVEALFHLYKNNRVLVDILHNLSHSPAQALESLSIGYFSNPGYKYHIRGSNETFKSYETNHHKAYQNHMKNKLREHFQELF